MTMKEILLGDYKLVFDDGWEIIIYDIYLHDKKIGWVVFLNDMSLLTLCTDDTDLITLLLLRYQVSPLLHTHPFNK